MGLETEAADPIDEFFEALHAWGETVDERLAALEEKVERIVKQFTDARVQL